MGGGARLHRGIAGSRAISALLPAAGPSAGSSGSAHPTLALGMDKGRARGGGETSSRPGSGGAAALGDGKRGVEGTVASFTHSLQPPAARPIGGGPSRRGGEDHPSERKQGPSAGDRAARRAGRRGARGPWAASGRTVRGRRRCQGSGGGRRCFPRRAEEEEEISGFLMRGCRRAERWDYTARRQSCGLCVRAGLVVSARLPANRTFSAVKKKPRHCGRAQRCLCDCDMKRWRSLPSPSLPLGLHFLPNSFCLPVF